MPKTRNNKRTAYIILQVLSFALSAGFPVVTIWRRFPGWVETVPNYQKIGFGFMLAVLVVVITFRKTIFETVKQKIGLTSVPPLVGWAVAWLIFETIVNATKVFADLRLICFSGLIGSALGTACSAISNYIYPAGKKSKSGEEE